LWKQQTRQAVLITYTMIKNLESEKKALWDRIYTTTAFFVGYSDDLTFYDYWEAIEKVYGESFSPKDLEDESKLSELQTEILEINRAKIVSSPIYPWQMEETVGLRFMGQRFIPDSYIFQELVFDKVGFRLLPKGLDVMAVFGSQRAEEHLQEDIIKYPNYKEQLEKLKKEFSELTVQNWTQNLYWSWLYSIKSVLEKPSEGHPPFMKTSAWLDEKLNTALGSWTELRHDTILYAKQSYTLRTSVPEVHQGFVEPLPELYARLGMLSDMTLNGLDSLALANESYKEKLLEFRELLDFLQKVSVKELKGERLSDEEIKFIRGIGSKLSSILSAFTKESQKSTLVADVHTDPNSMKVLEEACGYIDLLVAVYKTPDGELFAAAGPVFSYYEFAQPINQRLTDEEWIDMLKSGVEPSRPEWTSSFHVSMVK